jgi:hypothetical protein
MLGKLETKIQREIQQRIESQCHIQKHLHDMGEGLQSQLLNDFEQQCHSVQLLVTELEASLAEWEPSILRDLTENR